MKWVPAWWLRMSERKQAGFRLAFMAVVLLVTVLTLVSVSSYFFTWRQDQSVASAAGAEVQNAAASSGFSLGRFLVTDSFGVAALLVVAFLVVWSVKLCWKGCPWNLKKWFLGCLTGAFLFSWLASFLGEFLGLGYVFGSGLGGRAGSALVDWMLAHVGMLVTGLALLALLVVWLYCLSRRFSDFVMGRKPEREPEPATAEEPAIEAEPVIEETEVEIPVEEPEEALPEAAPFVSSLSAGEEEPKPSRKKKTVVVQPEQEGEGKFEVVTDESLEEEVKEPLPPINNRLDPPDGLPKYKTPDISILGDYANARHEVSQDELNRNNNKIRATLASYKIQVRDVTAVVGPTVTLYKVYPAPGVKISAIKQLQEDIGISLNAKGVRITTLSDSVGIEVANDKASIVPLKALLNSPAFRESKAELPVAIGYTISQEVKVFDLADAPHLLVAGATKQGKSVGLNVIVASLLYSKHPSELKFVFVDPKMVEFTPYGRLLHHYLAVLPNATSEQEEKDRAIVKNAKDAAAVLQSLCVEMDARYELLSKAFVNNIKLYNAKFKERHLRTDEGHHFLPYIVVVVDEYADLTMSVGAGPESKALARSITTSVIRLAQKGRAAGLHVILATQRPTVDVITGLIKANFPMRIAFRVTSRIDSATILDQPGADKLIGRGDMLLYSGVEMERVQCAFIGNDEIVGLTQAVGDQVGYQKSYNTPYYLPEPPAPEGEESSGGGMVDMKALDERFEEAAKMIVINQRGSTSDLQRRLGMGYAKAGRVMDQLEAAGIVGPQNGAKPREVLVKDLNELEEILKHFMA